MKPGDRITENGIEFVVCAVLNDDDVFANIPVPFMQGVLDSSGVKKVEWPLGIYITFMENGMALGVFGFKEGKLTNGLAHLPMKDDEVPSVGEVMWDLWKKYRHSDDERTIHRFHKLMKETQDRLKTVS